VQTPVYDGPKKTDIAPELKSASRASLSKAAFDPASIAKPLKRKAATPDFGDQKPRRPSAVGNAEAPEQYIRLRIRVEGGRLSVVDSHLVDGPLGQVAGFPGTNAYEVTLGDRLLHAGALPDLGVRRSFPNPSGPPEQRSHQIIDRSVYEFMARVPAKEVTPDTIGKIAVRLHRVKEQAQADRLSNAPLSSQFAREMRPVFELVGLPESALPEAIERRGARTPKV
jgi:hypothetical protein